MYRKANTSQKLAPLSKMAKNLPKCSFILIKGKNCSKIDLVMVDQKIRITTKTCLYNFDPLKPHFYIVKLGFTGVCIIFLISAQKHRLWYLLEPPRRGDSNEYPQSMF